MSKKLLFKVAGFILATFVLGLNLQAQGLDVNWGHIISPNKIQGTPVSSIVTDAKGSIYQFLTATDTCTVGGVKYQFTKRYTAAILSKWSATGTHQWTRIIKGPKVATACAITVAGGKVYVVGTYDNHREKNKEVLNGTSLKFQKVDIEKKDINTPNEDEYFEKISIGDEATEQSDIYFASYDIEGNLQKCSTFRSNKSQGEIPTKMIYLDKKLYIVGNSSGKGIDPVYSTYLYNKISIGKIEVYTGDEEKEGKLNAFSFILCTDASTLVTEKIYTMKPEEGTVTKETIIVERPLADGSTEKKPETFYYTEQDELSLTSLVASNNRVYVVGSTNAISKFEYNNTEKSYDLKSAGQSLIYAELNLATSDFSTVRTLNGTDPSWTMGYCITADSKGNIYVGGTTGENQYFSHNTKLNGAFIAQWNIANESPSKYYAIGDNSDSNVLKSMVARGSYIYLLGDYSGEFNATSITHKDVYYGDSFVGRLDLNSGKVDKLLTYGSNNIDEAQQLCLSKDQLFFTGYYAGSGFNLLENKIYGAGRFREKYYLASIKIANDSLRAIDGSTAKNGQRTTAVEELNNAVLFTVAGNTITWNVSGQYAIYGLNGSVVAGGQARAGVTTTLARGNVYIIKINGKVTKVIL